MASKITDVADPLPKDCVMHTECRLVLMRHEAELDADGGTWCTCLPYAASGGGTTPAHANPRQSLRLSGASNGSGGSAGSSGPGGAGVRRVCFCSRSAMAAQQGQLCKYGADGTVDVVRGGDTKKKLKRAGMELVLKWWDHGQLIKDYTTFDNPPGLALGATGVQAALDHVKGLVL